MSEDVKNPELVEDVTSEAELQEEQIEELVEEEILDEESQEESLEEAKTEGKHEEEEEEEEDDKEESVKEEAPKVEIPKTKAGVIQAAVDMLKAARKEDAQKMFAKLVKIDGEEESIKSADAAMKGGKKAQDPKAKAKVENVDFDEDLDAIINEEATLSDGFRDKAGAIFEAVLTSKLSQEIERLESEYAQNLEEEVTDVQNDLVEKVNGYLDYVVENWMKENEVAVTQGLRTEIAEDFMTSLQSVFKEHYIEVPEGKVDLVDELNEQVNELEDTLNKTTQDNIDLHSKVQSYERNEVVRDMSEGLVETDAEKLASLVEDIEFDNKENFEIKVKTVKESYFKSEVTESVDEVDSLLGSDAADENEKVVSSSMSQYTQAITKFNK
tara:strand:+ start:252 stop:1403 length:1152 start_codon:yes stop_codon:yes gene_type:complete